MKNTYCSLSRFGSGLAVLFLIFSISNSCTKIAADESDNGLTPVPPIYRVTIQGGYNPAEIKISAGNKVTWTNEGTSIESITSDDGLLDGIVAAGETYSFKFTSAGTYTYHSRIHSSIQGTVVVN
jgi:plastocyanin